MVRKLTKHCQHNTKHETPNTLTPSTSKHSRQLNSTLVRSYLSLWRLSGIVWILWFQRYLLARLSVLIAQPSSLAEVSVFICSPRCLPDVEDSQGQALEPLILENFGRQGNAHTENTIPWGERLGAHHPEHPRFECPMSSVYPGCGILDVQGREI